MKFGEYLRLNLTSEWNCQYVSYEEMKEYLYEIQTKAPTVHSLRQEYFLQEDQQFFQYCEKELSKVNRFFTEKLSEALLRFDLLENEVQLIDKSSLKRPFAFSNLLYLRKRDERNNEENVQRRNRTNSISYRKKTLKGKGRNVEHLKLALSEFYLNLILLKNYQRLNWTAFIKILKKHDKLFETNRGYQWRISSIDCSTFVKSSSIDQLIENLELLYTNEIENGNRTKAMERLRLPPLEQKQSLIVFFRLGIFLGMICILIPLLIYIGISSKNINWRVALHLYRSSFLILFSFLLFGFNVYGWSKNGVNHVLIFELDPRNHLKYGEYLQIGTFFIFIWLISFILFFIFFRKDCSPYIQPLIFQIFLFICLLNPFPIFYLQSRKWFIKKIFRVFFSPFYSVQFCDFWLADQLCSLELIFFDLEYFFCFYFNNWKNILSTTTTTTTITTTNDQIFCSGWSQIVLQIYFLILPSWFRFVQCLRRYYQTKEKFPHLVNAGKYSSTFFVHITNSLRRSNTFNYHQNKLQNPFFYLWIFISFLSSIYKLIWDIYMDWGIGLIKHQFLREQTIYSKKIYYYLSILFNIILRFLWIINIFIQFNSSFGEYSDLLGFLFAIFELLRRFIWNYFRLENEHLNNCGQFRAVRDISIQPTQILSQQLSSTNNHIPLNIIHQSLTTS